MIKKENYELYNGDCLNVMRQLNEMDVAVDLILTDPPYGTTPCKWDNIISFSEMWDNIHNISKERAPTLLFGIEPFSSHLRLSNLKQFKYDWIWYKEVGTTFLNANRTPLPSHEIISVFYDKAPTYNPQKRYVGNDKKRKNKVEGGELQSQLLW